MLPWFVGLKKSAILELRLAKRPIITKMSFCLAVFEKSKLVKCIKIVISNIGHSAQNDFITNVTYWASLETWKAPALLVTKSIRMIKLIFLSHCRFLRCQAVIFIWRALDYTMPSCWEMGPCRQLRLWDASVQRRIQLRTITVIGEQKEFVEMPTLQEKVGRLLDASHE